MRREARTWTMLSSGPPIGQYICKFVPFLWLIYGPKIEESASRNAYSTVTHCDTGAPAFIAGFALIWHAAKTAFSVSPKGSRLTTLTRSSFPSASISTLSVTTPCTPSRRASRV